jgi:hypothetical protein
VADIAVLYPIESLQAAFAFDRPNATKPEWGGESNPFFDFLVLSDMLSTRCHRDFTFLQPSVFLDERCQVTATGLELKNQVNHEKYTTLILPSGACLSEAALRKARDFARSGGLVIATGQLPYFASESAKRDEAVRALVKELFGTEPKNLTAQFGTRLIGSDGRDIDAEARKIFEAAGTYTSQAIGKKGGRAIYIPAITPALITKALSEGSTTPDIQFEGISGEIAPMGVFGYLHKVRDEQDLYLLANSTDSEVKGKVTLRGTFKTLEAWDAATGRITPIAMRTAIDAKGAAVTEAELTLQPVTDVFWVGRKEHLAAGSDATASGSSWFLPPAREVQLRGTLGDAYSQGVQRLSLPPYDSPVYLRSDISFEINRIFVNFSGDVSGRFIQISSLVSPPGQMTPPALREVLQDIAKYQKPDGHFGREVDWNEQLEFPKNAPENSNAKMLPIFWGNSRLLVGLLEAWRAFGREECLTAARRIGDFYIATADRFLDPAREPEYRMTGTYAAGYPTDYFPGIEGLVLLNQATRDERYLRQAERMAEFFKRFDTLPIDHSHGNLVSHYGLLLLYETTGKREYLEQTLAQWRKAVEGGFVWPMGGVGERFHISCATDEGCSEADWLRLNLQLWKLTGETRFLEMAERLIWNHYAMNRTANGGYGHHEFVCDDQGPLLMKPAFTEAVWCCTFHGILGLHTLKSYLVAASPKGVFINFPVSAEVPVRRADGRWRVSVDATEATLGKIQCRVRLDALDGQRDAPPVFLRRPFWATGVAVADGQGHPVSAREEQGYLALSVPPGAPGEVIVSFSGSPRVEDRRMRPVALEHGTLTRQAGVTLWIGPHLLLASADKPRPVLIAQVGKDGGLILPAGNRFPQVDRLDITEEQIRRAIAAPARLPLAPWESIPREANAAFVFDLIGVGDTTHQ